MEDVLLVIGCALVVILSGLSFSALIGFYPRWHRRLITKNRLAKKMKREQDFWHKAYSTVEILNDGYYYIPDDQIADEVEDTEIYAWKLFKVYRDVTDPNSPRYVFHPIHQLGEYSLFGPNYYAAGSSHKGIPMPVVSQISDEEWHRMVTTYIFDEGYFPHRRKGYSKSLGVRPAYLTVAQEDLCRMEAWNAIREQEKFQSQIVRHEFGYYSWNHPKHVLQDLRSEDMYILAKIRIWGEVIEATKGYQSEYFQFEEFFVFDDDFLEDPRFSRHLHLDSIDWYMRSIDLVIGRVFIRSAVINSRELCSSQFADFVFPIQVRSARALLDEYDFRIDSTIL